MHQLRVNERENLVVTQKYRPYNLLKKSVKKWFLIGENCRVMLINIVFNRSK